MTVATDERLRTRSKELARTIVLDRARSGGSRTWGTSRLRRVPADRGGGLDIDGSLDTIATARAARRTRVWTSWLRVTGAVRPSRSASSSTRPDR